MTRGALRQALWLLVLALGFALGQLVQAAAGTADYMVRGWFAEGEEGLPENKIMSVLQSRDGYLWVGTYNGLARFDGVRFVLFDSSNTRAMRDSSVTTLFEARDGTLWIGHSTGEITRLRGSTLESVAVPSRPNPGKIRAFGQDETGELWLLNFEGMLTRVRDGMTFTLPSGEAVNLLELANSTDGRLWVARNGQLSVLDHGKVTVFQFPGQGTNQYTQGICASRDGGVWIASDTRLRKWREEHWVQDLGQAPWAGTPIHAFIETHDGRLVAGTSDHGFYIIDPQNVAGSLQFMRSNGFAADWVVSVCEDQEGGMWIGTGGAGLFAVRPRRVQTISPPDGWQRRAVLSVTPTRDGALWVGTEGAGLYRLKDGRWDNYAKDAGIRNPYIWSVAEDEATNVWAGTWGGSLYHQCGEQFERAKRLEGLTTPMPALAYDHNCGLLVGTGEGLLRYAAGEQPEWLAREDHCPPRDVRAILRQSDGTIWFGTFGGGLCRLKDGKMAVFRKQDGLASEFVQCLHADQNGSLWAGTFGGGLNRLRDGKFAVIDRQRGLPSPTICHIEEDEQGFFWMSSHGGLLRVSKAELDECADGTRDKIECLAYGLSDGMPTLKCSGGLQPAGCRTADGHLYFATGQGLVAVDPRKVATNPLAPPVVIETLLVDDRAEAVPKPGDAGVRIAPGRHRFEFQFTGLSFVAPEKVRFKRRLQNLEKDWIEIGTKRSANYSFLPPGDYAFQVAACNNDGVWNEAGAEMAFTVLPFFWQTLWFRLFAAGAGVGASGGIMWFETRRRMRRKLEISERQRAIEHERARIAHDIHDDLGAHLTSITMLSESAREEMQDRPQAEADLDLVCQTARALTRSLDEIVWAVNPRHDTLDGLVSYLEKFAQDFLGTANIRCRLELPSAFPDWNLTTELRHNLFLAFKEALNNTVKHAKATEVRITLTEAADHFELVVTDNGGGFSSDEFTKKPLRTDRFATGDGLESMRLRLAEIGGNCEIRSSPGQGTTIRFIVPVKRGAW
ncbi:MAG TPA: two-component regulator propeller domain-containing protein [Candidatus Dormibacteraeota bacterium]|nr:two-component regulator propeller domain-containing protein [Candidatus Dormibacteraeota bacterium]